MTGPILTRPEWLEARKALLVKEKEALRVSDALALERQKLGIVPVDGEYTFTALDGKKVTLADLFQGRKQLIIHHFMLGPDDEEGCVGCSFFADNLPNLVHLNSRQTSFAAISRAPIEKLNAFKKRMGWDFPWYSSYGSSFNYDYQATSDASVTPVTYNYHDQKEIEARSPLQFSLKGEQQGISVFLTKYGKIFHAYSSYSRGIEKFHPTYQMLDMTPLGRQEEGPIPGIVADFKHHDKYPAEVTLRG